MPKAVTDRLAGYARQLGNEAAALRYEKRDAEVAAEEAHRAAQAEAAQAAKAAKAAHRAQEAKLAQARQARARAQSARVAEPEPKEGYHGFSSNVNDLPYQQRLQYIMNATRGGVEFEGVPRSLYEGNGVKFGSRAKGGGMGNNFDAPGTDDKNAASRKDTFLVRLEEAEAADRWWQTNHEYDQFGKSHVHRLSLHSESRSPPNYARGSMDV